ncbi:hypothetical protein RUND412_001315 [Rhizina undulata]
MASSTSTTTSGSRKFMADWEKRVEDVKVSKTSLNTVVMDYLIKEGYQATAIKFAQEANISHQIDLDLIEERAQIRNAIHRGNIQMAVERINELDSTILDKDHALHFALLRLQLIELIRSCTASSTGDITPALTFATTHLAPRAPGNSKFLMDLERTMALLCFPPDNLAPVLAELLDPALRRDVAARVNEALLRRQGLQKEAKIRSLVRLRGWAENAIKNEWTHVPEMKLGLDLATCGDENMTSS